MPITTIIIDDEPEARNVLTSMCQRSEHSLEVLDTCGILEQAVGSIDRNKPDLLLLDIELVDGLGFEVLDAYELPKFRTVFVSAFDQYALKAVKYHALDYLLKPVDEDEFNHVMDRMAVSHELQNVASDLRKIREYIHGQKEQRLGIPTTHGIHYYHLEEIVRLESDGSYTILYLMSGEQVVVCKNLKEFERLLPSKNFLRVHRKHLVNLKWVRGINRDNGGYLIMKNGDKVSHARSAKNEITRILGQNSVSVK